MTFDYERAWIELAKPGFETRPQNVRDLYERVARECSEFGQTEVTLDMPWPKESDLRAVFDKVPAEELAAAARIVYFYGHWSPEPGISRFGNGAHWRFSNYADQSLRGRLSEATGSDFWTHRHHSTGGGVSFRVHEGFLRACYSSRDEWRWEEIGLATVTTLERAQAIGGTPGVYFDEWIKTLKEACLPKGGFIEKFFDLYEYGA